MRAPISLGCYPKTRTGRSVNISELKHISIRLSPTDIERLGELAEKTNLTKSDYVRKLINGYVPRESPPVAYIKMMNELSAIGNNLNQIAYIANSTGVIDTKGYSEVVTYLFEKMRDIDRTVMGEDKINGDS